MLARLACCAALLLLTACAAALPGYTPPPFKESNKSSQPMKSGEMTADGRYEMANEEREMDCKRTAGAMSLVIERIKYKSSEVGSSPAAILGNKLMSPFRNTSDKGFDRDAEYLRDRARLEAYNRHLASKGCPTVDVAAELAKPPEPIGKKY